MILANRNWIETIDFGAQVKRNLLIYPILPFVIRSNHKGFLPLVPQNSMKLIISIWIVHHQISSIVSKKPWVKILTVELHFQSISMKKVKKKNISKNFEVLNVTNLGSFSYHGHTLYQSNDQNVS